MGIERHKKLKKISFDPKASEPCWNIEVFKTSDVLNSDENIVNIALMAFCSLAETKLAHLAMSSLLILSYGVGLWQIVLQLSCRLF